MSHKIQPVSKELLQEKYNQSGVTISSLAKEFNTSQPTVRKWLIEYNISRKSHAQASIEANNRLRNNPPRKEELLNEYKYHSVDWLEKKYSVGQETIYQWLKNYEIYNQERKILTSEGQLTLHRRLCENDSEAGWILNDRTTIHPLELDIVSHKKKIAIEYCGSYWHSDIHKPSNYHINKLELCESKGYRLITVFDSDDIDKVFTFISTPKLTVGARDCQVAVGESLEEFETRYHIMGSHEGKIKLALKYNGAIVASMSFSRSRYNKNYQWEMIRYTTSDIAVIGGSNKLFSFFVKNYNPQSIVTYSDRRYSAGKVYSNLGFLFKSNTKPNYWYFKRGTTTMLSRQNFMKHKLPKVLTNYDPAKTERENMSDNGYYRVYDCGSSVWVWSHINNSTQQKD